MVLLCSASPRRKQILENLGLRCYVLPSSIEEREKENEKPLDYLYRICKDKLEHSLKKWYAFTKNHPACQLESGSIMAISGDTIVVKDEKILQKPVHEKEAILMLKSLVGTYHFVYSGLYLIYYKDNNPIEKWDYDTTEVWFSSWNQEEISSYVYKFNPLDKAGSYGIQDSLNPVEKFIGSYSNVVGFPLRKFLPYLPIAIQMEDSVDCWNTIQKVYHL